jgi:dUTP pyrophosphatase
VADRITLSLTRLAHGEGLPLPHYRTDGSAGMDLAAAVPEDAPLTIPPGGRAAVPTGFQMSLPSGYEGQLRPRSGIARDFGVTVANAPGTVDSDYRGEVHVLLANLGSAPFVVRRGMRIAQLVVARVAHADVVEVGALEATERGEGGFGSTGLEL